MKLFYIDGLPAIFSDMQIQPIIKGDDFENCVNALRRKIDTDIEVELKDFDKDKFFQKLENDAKIIKIFQTSWKKLLKRLYISEVIK